MHKSVVPLPHEIQFDGKNISEIVSKKFIYAIIISAIKENGQSNQKFLIKF